MELNAFALVNYLCSPNRSCCEFIEYKPFAEIDWYEDENETKCLMPRQGAKIRMKQPSLFRVDSGQSEVIYVLT